MEILESFGVQPILLLAQVVNFLILLFILKRFLYKPLLKVLEERKTKIAQGLENAAEIERRLAKIEAEKEDIFAEAEKQSKKALDEATATAAKIVADAHSKASLDVAKIIDRAEKSMSQEREKLHQEIRSELATLVVTGIQKVAGKVLTEKDKKELVEGAIKDLK